LNKQRKAEVLHIKEVIEKARNAVYGGLTSRDLVLSKKELGKVTSF